MTTGPADTFVLASSSHTMLKRVRRKNAMVSKCNRTQICHLNIGLIIHQTEYTEEGC